jgi:hypothetical protein
MAGFFGLAIVGIDFIRRRSVLEATMAYGPYLLLSGLIVHFYAGPVLDRILQIVSYF